LKKIITTLKLRGQGQNNGQAGTLIGLRGYFDCQMR